VADSRTPDSLWAPVVKQAFWAEPIGRPAGDDFFLKGLKIKINSEKGADLKFFLKNGYLPPDQRAGGVAGHLPHIQRAGGAKFFSRPLPRVFSRIRNFSYSRRGP
jgi:hypothetical protein